MNQVQSYPSHSPTHLTSSSSYPPHSQPTSEMSQYPQYQTQGGMPTTASSYASQYPSQYYGGVTSPQSVAQPVSSSMSMGNQLAPLPNLQMPSHQGYSSSSHGQSYQQQQPPPQQPQQQHHQQHQQQQSSHQQQESSFDPTGQMQPVGAKPRVTATLWEDEGSLCFQVEAKGVCVARREDNHFINGTKLLNVAGMTRGRRDGILKSEKTRHVVKIGPMHLKGVWIPFERALDFANREKITDMLYPLFVHNISSLLYHPQNADRRGGGSLERKHRDRPASSLGTSQPSLHHSMSAQLPGQSPHSIAPHPTLNRPTIDRAHTFPTPPTSASAVAPQSGYDWSSQSMSGSVQTSQPLAIDTGLSNTRSMPSTPATTPPGNSMANMQSYQSNGSYDVSRSVYSGAPHTPGQYATQQQNLARFGAPMQPHGYIKNEMGPPSRGNMASGDEHADIKTEPYSQPHGGEQSSHDAGDGEQGHEAEYSQDHGSSYHTTRGPFSYATTSTIGSMPGDHSNMASEQVESSPHQSGSGRGTPRAAVSQSNWQAGYNTPPRTGTSGSLYGGLDSRGSLVNGHNVDYNSSYSMNGVSNKRGREDEEGYKSPMNSETLESIKRRKSGREGSINAHSSMPFNYGSQSTSAILQGAHR